MTSRALIAMSAIVFSVGVGCSGAPTSGGGTGGFEPSGGAVGNGGTTSSGGTVGSGGTNGSGGTVGSGGTSGSGGTVGSGGTASSGGRIGSGGTTSNGGSDRSGGTTGSGGATSSGGTTASTGGVGSGGRPGSGGTTGAGGIAGSGGTGRGGATTGSGGTPGTGGSTAAGFEWGSTTYNANGGSAVRYQGHFTGQGCLSCKTYSHRTLTLGGTAYQGTGASTAANALIGIRVNGSLTTTYSGSQGNFYANVSGATWSTAQIAIRTSAGTLVMPANPSANGDCNSCHGSSNPILTP